MPRPPDGCSLPQRQTSPADSFSVGQSQAEHIGLEQLLTRMQQAIQDHISIQDAKLEKVIIQQTAALGQKLDVAMTGRLVGSPDSCFQMPCVLGGNAIEVEETHERIAQTTVHENGHAKKQEDALTSDILGIDPEAEDCDEYDEPNTPFKRRKGRLHQIVHHSRFEALSGAAIVLNTIVMIIQLEQHGMESAVKIGYSEDEHVSDAIDVDFLEHGFVLFFVLELLVRWLADGFAFWRDTSNVFDAIVVLFTTLDAYIPTGTAFNLSIMRLIRLLRVAKIFRAFKAASLFSELRVLIRTIVFSLMALLWSTLLLGLIIMAAGLLMGQLMQSFIDDESIDLNMRRWTYRHYGGAFRPMWTMFEATLSGGWPTYARPVISTLSPWFVIFWISYVLTVYFAVIRILSALFLSTTLNVSKQDEDMMIVAKLKELEKYTELVKHFFHQADTSGDGVLQRSEFEAIMQTEKATTWLSALELEVHEVTALFDLISDSQGQAGIDEFVMGAKRMKGQARATDAVMLMHEQHNVKQHLDELHIGLSAMWKALRFDEGKNPFAQRAGRVEQLQKRRPSIGEGSKLQRLWSEAMADDDDQLK